MGAASKLRFKWATGVSVADDQLVATVRAVGIGGSEEVESIELPIPEEGLAEGLRGLREQLNVRGPVTVGVDLRKVFFVSKQQKPTDEEDEDRSSRGSGKFVEDSASAKLPAGTFVSTSMCERKLAREALNGFADLPFSKLHLQPSLLALHRVAVARAQGPRRWRTVIRLLPGKSSYLAILSHGGQVLVQRLFDCPPEAEVERIRVTLNSLFAYAAATLRLTKIDGILIHDGDEEGNLADESGQFIDPPVRSVARVDMDQRTVAEGLALSGLKPAPSEIDLFRSLRPPPGLKENFPFATAMVLGLIVAVSFWMLKGRADALEGQIEGLKRQATEAAKYAGGNVGEIGLKRDALMKEVDVAQAFVVNRIYWTEVIKEVERCLPEGVVLLLLSGHDTIAIQKRLTKQQEKKAKKYLTAKKGAKVKVQKDLILSGAVMLQPGETRVPEIPIVLEGLRNSPLIRREFPVIGGADVQLKEKKSERGAVATLAEFSVKCRADASNK